MTDHGVVVSVALAVVRDVVSCGTSGMAGLRDRGVVSGCVPIYRRLSLSNRRSTEDCLRVHHGQPSSDCHTHRTQSVRLVSVRHLRARSNRRDVPVRGSADGLGARQLRAVVFSRRETGRAVALPAQTRQRQRRKHASPNELNY